MNNLPIKKEQEVLHGEFVKDELQALDDINQDTKIILRDFNRNITQYDKNINYLDNVNNKYWLAQRDLQHIENNEFRKYDNLKCAEVNLLQSINNSNLPYGIWKYKKKFYYRPKPNLDLCEGNTEEISKAISSRYPFNVQIVSDLNNIPNNPKEMRFDTVFIAEKSVITIEDEIIAPEQEYEIFEDDYGVFYRNLIINTDYLKERIINYSLDENYSSKPRQFIQKMTNAKDSLFLLNRLGNLFKTLRGRTSIVMIENKEVSKDIFLKNILKPMFHSNNYISLTDQNLAEMTIAEILKSKLLILIDTIPQTQELRDKLKELLIHVLINESFEIEGKKIPTYAEVIITLDNADPFLKDFENLCDIFYINSKEEILSQLNINNDISLISDISDDLMTFAKELSAIGTQQLNTSNYSTGNERFLNELNEVVTPTNELSNAGLPIFNPYNESFEKLYPKGDFHTLITGVTRYGKSFLMISLIMGQIKRADSSVIIFDVHSDLARKIIKLVKDKERLLYINPLLDERYSLTINLFHIEDKSAMNIARMTQVILNVLMSINTDKKLTDNMEILLTHCIRVLLIKGNSSFKELNRFMNDKRNHDLVEFAKKVSDDEEEYFSDYFPSETATKLAVRRRISKLTDDPLFSNLMNGDNTVSLEKEVNTEGKIIIFDIPKGMMENTYSYCISFFMEYIQIIALNRVQKSIDKRLRTHVFLDEFQNFVVSKNNVKTILTETGKYGLFFTMANHVVSQFKGLTDTVLDMTEAKFIGKSHNDTLLSLERTINAKLPDAENLGKGEFYLSVENNEIVKIKNTSIFLDDSEEISDDQLEENKQYQLNQHYRPIKEKRTQLTENELIEKIQQFKEEILLILSSQKTIEESCLNNIVTLVPAIFKELKSDTEYLANNSIKRPRIRQQEIITVFQMAFEVNVNLANRKFISMLKSENTNDMFNHTESGTRSGEFTDNGKTQTEQYYYFQR